MASPNTPEPSAIPTEADLYDRLAEAVTPYAGPALADQMTDTLMGIFADHLRAQVEHFTRLAQSQPQQSPAGRAAGNAYRAAAGHLRNRADELAGGA